MTKLTQTTETNNPRTLNEIKRIREQRTTETLKKYGVFWAFSNQQFEENKTPLQEWDKYVSIGMGGYMPKSKVNEFLDAMEADKKWYKNAIKSQKLRKQEIAYELANHEAYYTGDISDTMEALGKDYTEAEVFEVYRAERKKRILANQI